MGHPKASSLAKVSLAFSFMYLFSIKVSPSLRKTSSCLLFCFLACCSVKDKDTLWNQTQAYNDCVVTHICTETSAVFIQDGCSSENFSDGWEQIWDPETAWHCVLTGDMCSSNVLGSDLWGPDSLTPCHLERTCGTRVYYLLVYFSSRHGTKQLSVVYLLVWMPPLLGILRVPSLEAQENGSLLPRQHNTQCYTQWLTLAVYFVYHRQWMIMHGFESF